jgi:23S rRNA pseudouridine2605 synthase/16S rRNA pseudouridine516 synthase
MVKKVLMATLRSGDPLPEGVKNADRPPIPEWDDQAPAQGIRIQKVMAQAGVASRRVAENMIAQGRVAVNGITIVEPGLRIDPEVDQLTVDGVPIQLDASKRYLMLNKPVGVVSTMADDRGRADLSQFTDEFEERLFYVGRLDQDTSGLLILTNDGELAHVLAHPSFGVQKTYITQVAGKVTPQVISRLTIGFDLHDGFIQADKARLLSFSAASKTSLVEITLHSGRNRIVRRMMKEVGHPVQELVRRSFGPLHLGTLPIGAVRELSKVELGEVLALSKAHTDTVSMSPESKKEEFS